MARRGAHHRAQEGVGQALTGAAFGDAGAALPGPTSALGTASGLAVLAAATGIAFGAAGWLAPAAQATEFTSQYTSADLKKCRKIGTTKVGDSELGAAWSCPGAAGYVVSVSEDDLRVAVSVGKNVRAAQREPAAGQSFGPFNFAYETVEWRSRGGTAPFAIIQRWNISDNDKPGKDGRPGRTALLIVTRLPPGPVCHVAYVDVAANPDANTLARQAADESATRFDCAKDQIRVVGQRGRAIDLAGK